MSNSFTEVTSESWFSRISNSFKSVLFGLLLFVVSFPLLFWNEGRAVKQYRTLKEGAGVVLSVAADKVEKGNEGRLVHVTARADTQEVLRDPVFAVEAKALRLERQVEMFQWIEEEDSRTEKKLGGSTETVTTYKYKQDWSGSLEKSGSFKHPEGHQNPAAMPQNNQTWPAAQVSFGAFTLPELLTSQLRGATPVTPTPEAVKSLALGKPAQIQGGAIFFGADPAQPAVGDWRVTFRALLPTEASIVAQQAGTTFRAYQTKAGNPIALLQSGSVPAAEMFQAAQAASARLTWILRLVGFLAMAIGLGMIFSPLAVLADVLPFLGSFLRFGIGIFAVLVAAPLSLLTIAVSWILVRPLLGLTLLLIAGGTVALVLWKRPRRATA